MCLAGIRLKELSALKVADEESLRRVTVSQETNTARQGVAFRRRRARRAQTAATIPGAGSCRGPRPIADLAAGFRYRWIERRPSQQCGASRGRSFGRTLSISGKMSEPDTLANVYAKLKKARRIHAVDCFRPSEYRSE